VASLSLADPPKPEKRRVRARACAGTHSFRALVCSPTCVWRIYRHHVGDARPSVSTRCPRATVVKFLMQRSLESRLGPGGGLAAPFKAHTALKPADGKFPVGCPCLWTLEKCARLGLGGTIRHTTTNVTISCFCSDANHTTTAASSSVTPRIKLRYGAANLKKAAR